MSKGNETPEMFVSRWGDTELDDKQYAWIPGFIMRNYRKFKHVETGEVVGITTQEFTVMSHIIAFKFDIADGDARPGLATIATYMGVSVDSVRRAKNSLKNKGAMCVEEHPGKPSSYSFPELVRQCRLCELEAQAPRRIAGGETVSTPRKIASPPLADLQGLPLAKMQGVPLADLQDEDKEYKSEDKSIAPRKRGRTKRPADSTPAPTQKSTTPAEVINPIKDAIATAFGWAWGTMTRSEKGMIQNAAKQLCDAGYSAADVATIHAYCVRQKWAGGFTPSALVNHASAAVTRKAPPSPLPAPADGMIVEVIVPTVTTYLRDIGQAVTT
jgi:hypothetical protein